MAIHAPAYPPLPTSLDDAILKHPNHHILFRNRVYALPTSSRPESEVIINLAAVGALDARTQRGPLPPKVNPGSRTKVHAKHGSLSMFMAMPVDIIYEVFSHLHPMDLLTLSYTSRSLRNILLAPHARTAVWAVALNGSLYTPPPCPPDMHERQYTKLIFENWCQSCYAPSVEQVSWLCRVRYCDDCIRQHFIPEEDLRTQIPSDIYIEKLATVFPYAMVSDPQPRDANLNLRRPLSSPNAQNGLGAQTHHIHASSSSSLQQNASANMNLGGSAQQDETRRRRKGDGRPVPVYHIPTIRRYLAELDVIAARKDESALERWSMEKKVIMSERIRHAVFTEYWSKNCAYRRSTWNLPSKASEFLVLVAVLLALVLLWWDKLVMLEVTMPSVPRWL